MQFTTKRIVTILTALAALDLAIGTGQVKITEHMIPAGYIDSVKDWAATLATLMTGAAALVGGWGDDTPATPKSPVSAAAAVLALAIALLFAMPAGTAHAQSSVKKPQVTGNLIADIKANNASGVTPGQGLDATWDKMKSVSLIDLQYAKALADNIGSSRSKIRSSCYGAWITVIQQSQGVTAGANGAPIGPVPDAALFTHFEQAVQVIDNLQPDSAFMVACQPAANLLKMSIAQFVASAVGGVTSLGALGLGIP